MKEVDPWVIIEKLRDQHKVEIHDVWMPLVAQHRENCERLQSRLESLEKGEERAIKERDLRDEVIDKLLDMVLCDDRAEWSNNYAFEDALIDVEISAFCIKQMTRVREASLFVTGGVQQANSITLFFNKRDEAHSFLRCVDDLVNTAMQTNKGE